MNKLACIISLLIAPLFLTAKAQQTVDDVPPPLDYGQKVEIIDSIVSYYADWDEMSISGKLSGAMLPMKVTAKVYMQKGKLTIISLSVPILGEVGRMEIDQDYILVINKMSNTYTQVAIEATANLAPGGLEALQNLILGRVTIMGSGQLKPEDAGRLEIYDYADNFVLIPNQELQPEGYVYYYAVDPFDYLLNIFIISDEDSTNQAQCFYSYDGREVNMDFHIYLNSKTIETSLKLNEPDNFVKPITRFELTSRYRLVSPSKILQ